LQSEEGEKLLARFDLPVVDFSSFVLIENGKAFTRSAAALKVAKKLSGLWPALWGFMIVPKFIRDGVYNWIARNDIDGLERKMPA
jgi:predicted DCC family thiol-disulfide oxidoreductase YuxK